MSVAAGEHRSPRDGRAALALLVAVSFVPAVVGSRFPPGDWYRQLAKPPWTPPDWLFAPVWTLLYLTIGIAAWLVWRHCGPRQAPRAWTAWAVQLVLNGAWSWLFFGLRAPGLALVEIVLLWLAIAWTVVEFRKLRPPAAALLLPYLAWVGFAAALNAALWRLNA